MSKKVLVVDDAEVIRNKLAEFFRERGYEADTAEDGKHGFEVATGETGPYDLIVTDLNMPFVDGMDLTKKLRELPNYEKTPIFVLSTESTKELKKRGKEAGITAWILKPFDPTSLENIMKVLNL